MQGRNSGFRKRDFIDRETKAKPRQVCGAFALQAGANCNRPGEIQQTSLPIGPLSFVPSCFGLIISFALFKEFLSCLASDRLDIRDRNS